MGQEREKRQRLEEKRIDLEIKQNRDALYMRILISFGTVSILVAAIMLLMFENEMFGKSIAMFAIGIFLLIIGLLWQHKDEKQLEEVAEDLQHYKDQEFSGYRQK